MAKELLSDSDSIAVSSDLSDFSAEEYISEPEEGIEEESAIELPPYLFIMWCL